MPRNGKPVGQAGYRCRSPNSAPAGVRSGSLKRAVGATFPRCCWVAPPQILFSITVDHAFFWVGTSGGTDALLLSRLSMFVTALSWYLHSSLPRPTSPTLLRRRVCRAHALPPCAGACFLSTGDRLMESVTQVPLFDSHLFSFSAPPQIIWFHFHLPPFVRLHYLGHLRYIWGCFAARFTNIFWNIIEP